MKLKAKIDEKKPEFKAVPSVEMPLPFSETLEPKMPSPVALSTASAATGVSMETEDYSTYEPSEFGDDGPNLFKQKKQKFAGGQRQILRGNEK